MAGSERDAGFCSGADEDDMSGLHSPSASEDSVEVQVTPISLRNKRKLVEPRKIQEPSTAPLKKRRKFELIQETVDEETRPTTSPSSSPFRPWSNSAKNYDNKSVVDKPVTIVSYFEIEKGARGTEEEEQTRKTKNRRYYENEKIHRDEARKDLIPQEEALRGNEVRIQEGILQRLQEANNRPISPSQSSTRSSVHSFQRRQLCQRFEPPQPLQTSQTPLPPSVSILSHTRLQEEPLSLVFRGGELPRVPSHPAVNGSFERQATYDINHVISLHPQSQNHETTSNGQTRHYHNAHQRNYKNMTRERRIEANARERTRVHTISAAFDTLRRAIPAYSHNQKLSKLSVLRIACSYIMTLSKIVNTPEGEPENSVSLGTCVDLVSKTIQTEGKLRKKKDE